MNYLWINAYVSLLLGIETRNACLHIVYLFLLQGSEGNEVESGLGTDLYRVRLSAKWHALAVGCGSFAERGSRQRADGTSRRGVTLFC